MPAGRSLVRHDPVGLGDLAKRFALVPLLPPAWPPGRFAKAHGLLPQPVARGGLRTRRTVQTQPAPEFRVLSPQRFQLPLKRRNQGRDLRRRNHSPTESYSASPDSPPNPQKPKIQQPVTNQTHPPGQLRNISFRLAKASCRFRGFWVASRPKRNRAPKASCASERGAASRLGGRSRKRVRRPSGPAPLELLSASQNASFATASEKRKVAQKRSQAVGNVGWRKLVRRGEYGLER